MTVGDVVQLRVQGTVQGQMHLHTLHFQYVGAGATEQGLIDNWQGATRTAYRGCFSTTDLPVQLLTATQVCGTLPLRQATEEAELTANQAGTISQSTDPAPSWLAVVFSLRTGLQGASRRGRFYMGGLYEGAIGGNNLNTASLPTWQAYATQLLAGFGAGGSYADYRLTVWSKTLRDIPGSTCASSNNLVTGILLRQPLGSMKSRKPGSGS